MFFNIMKISEIMTKIKNSFKGYKKPKKVIPNLLATPNHVCFKNYEEGQVYKEHIKIANKDVKQFHITIKFDNPEELKLSTLSQNPQTILESGDDILLEIEFCPILSFNKESVDRRYEISINIDNFNTRLLIPVVILSPNPSINFPREIQLPDTSIDTPAYTNICILNYSNLPYKFSIDTKSEVKIIPDCKVIAMKPGDGISFLVEFIPRALSDFREKIYICFENVKRMSILLKCNVLPVNVFMIEDSIEFLPTLIGMRDVKSIQIVNNSETATLFEWMPIENHCANENNEEHPSLKFLEIYPMNGELPPQTLTKIDLIFKPEDTNDDEDDFEIQKDIIITLALRLSICHNYNPSIIVKGKVVGPSFQLDHKIININEIFVGESRNVDVNLKNMGDISGKVFFHKIQSVNDGIMKASSKVDALKAGEVKKFRIQFLARKIGKFIDQAIFKVKNGEKLTLSIQGVIKPLSIIPDPPSILFPTSAICVPQMKFLKLTNKHPFDVDIRLEVENNGHDNPLEFLEFYGSRSTSTDSISKSSSLESMNNNNHNITTESCSSLLTRTSIKNFMERSGEMEQLRDTLTTTTRDEIVKIFNKVDEYLERKEIVSGIVSMLFDDKLCNDVEKRQIVQTVVELLIKNLTESDELKFYEKNWQLPEHPRQIECSKSFIKIQSKSFEEVKIFVVPNYVGKFTRNLKLFIAMSDVSHQPPIDETIVNIPIVIDCQTADIKIHNQTNEITGYAESEITLDIHIENLSSIHGFFTFQNFLDNEMEVKCTDEKFHISRKSKKILNLIIIPLKSGKIMKYVNIIALGSNRKYPITIECKSLPPDIVINHKKIFVNDLEVLKKDDTRIFIENRSTTKARFFIKLEHDNQCFTINPRGGILSSKQCTVVMLEKFFHDPGDYRDILNVEIVNSKVIKIPIRCTVKKLPITIEPSFCNLIDFGTLFTSKNSYYLDYKFTNCGKISYMIFIILKNWKNRSEIRYTIEPNRFELSPNCSRVVKFSLNALNASSYVEEFTIEGCSIHFPIRELIWESKLKANVIKPTINFSTNELIFNCFYGQEDDLMANIKLTSIEISNGSALPLTVALKTEGEFSIYVSELNSLEQKVSFDLKVKESRKIFINFNLNHLKNYSKSRTFEGIIRAYSLGQIQSTLKLIAHLIYPEIELSTNDVNIITNPKQSCTSNFIISNWSDKLAASFELKFKDNSTIITSIHEKRKENLSKILECLMKQKRNLMEKNSNYKIFYVDDDCEISNLNNDNVDKNSNEVNSFKVIEVPAKEIRQYFDSMTKEIPDIKFNEEPRVELPLTSNDEHDECSLLLSQMKGILKPYERRKIHIKFSGSNKEFHFSSIIGCQVVGGSCYDICIKITNCNPNVLITRTYFDITKSWQEISINSLCISNINPLKNVIKVITPKIKNEAAELIEGYVKLSTRTPTKFILDDEKNLVRNLKFTIFPGCMPIFETKFDIQINDKSPIPISFYSQNNMPMATLLDIDRNSLYDLHKVFEYDCLREMFKYVDRIRVQEETINFEDVSKAKLKFQELHVEREKKVNKKSIKKRKTIAKMEPKTIDSLSAGDSCDLMSKELRLFYGENGKALMCEKPHRMFSGKMLQMVDDEIENGDFLALDYPNEYPQSHEIISFIAQYGFAKSLGADEIFNAYKSIYDRYVVEKFRHSKKSNGCREQCCDNSIVVPLPLVLVEYSLDFGDVKIDDVYEKTIKLYLHSDFKSAAIRTEALIPDFVAEFLPYSEFFKINSYKNEEISFKYLNRHERQLQLSEEPENTVRRCHSFDFIEGKVHSRIISKGKDDIDQINQTYNEKMSPKVKFDDRSPYTLTEIFQKAEFNETDSRVIEFKIIFSPKIDNYDEVKTFDEVLYIDLHLGPQIPIHITANIIQPDPEPFFE